VPKPGQTFKKRQREHKLREKAQLKRERRQQRKDERKTSEPVEGSDGYAGLGQDQDAETAAEEPGAEGFE
jgi:hypothetical protein